MSNGVSESDTFLFTSESVGEGHPGEFVGREVKHVRKECMVNCGRLLS